MSNEVTNIIEPVLLTKIHIDKIGRATLSDQLPLLEQIAVEWKLKLNRMSDFRIAVKILEQSAQKN